MSTSDSFKRTVTLSTSIAVAISSGTNYVYSAYAPQLGHKLGLNHEQLNLIGFGGNAGNYMSGPFWGRVVDGRGPRILLTSAFALLLAGYGGIRLFFDQTITLPTSVQSIFSPAVFALTVLQFITGMGGNAGITAALNTTAKSFSDQRRASVTGLVISGFGLSAFMFSSIAHVAFPGNTSDFLLLLAVGTAIPQLIGVFLLKPIPHADHPGHVDPVSGGGADGAVEVFSSVVGPAAYERLDDHEEEDDEATWRRSHRSSRSRTRSQILETVPILERISSSLTLPRASSRQNSGQAYASVGDEDDDASISGESLVTLSNSQSHPHMMVVHPDIHGWELLKSADFWIMFLILSLLSGTGLMWINNVGSITQALHLYDRNGSWDEKQGSKEQAFEVSVTSLGNCLGRVLIGVFADIARNRWGTPRAYLITLISLIMTLSQVIAMGVVDLDDLWKASAAVGLGYGGTFGLLPVVTIEWFGLAHFSQNWGFVSLAPVIAGNLFSLAFGRNLDAHASSPKETVHNLERRGGLPSELLCYQGRSCYVDSLRMTTVACILAVGLSVYAGWMDQQKTKMLRRPIEHD